MKKLFICTMTICMIFCLCACSSEKGNLKEENNNQNETQKENNNQNETQKENKTDVKPLTLEEVMNHPVTPEKDFEYEINENNEVEIYDYLGNDDIVIIPDTIEGKPVVFIGGFIFGINSKVRGLKLSDKVRELDVSVFALNSNFEIFVSGTGLETIDNYCFQSCEKLHTVILKDGLKTIKSIAFAGSRNIKELYISDSVTTIEPGIAFERGEDLVLVGSKGSLAEKYAKKEGLGFREK